MLLKLNSKKNTTLPKNPHICLALSPLNRYQAAHKSTRRFNKLNMTSDAYPSIQISHHKQKINKETSPEHSFSKLRFNTINIEKFKKLNKKRKQEISQFRKIQKRNQDQNFNTCAITVIQGKTRYTVNCYVTSFEELARYLKRNSHHVCGYQTVPSSLVVDYYLSMPVADGSFLNGSSITLKPLQSIKQNIINLDSFEIIKCVGTGGFSKVFLCRFLQDGKFYAMKVIEKRQLITHKKERVLTNELQILKRLKGSPFIIDLKFCFQTKNQAIFILEFCPGGEFFGLIKKFRKMSEDLARFYFVEILFGLQSIHKHNILYRDFKPENLLLDLHGHLRIADFGLSKPLYNHGTDRSYSFCGSPQYMPPQIINRTSHSFTADFYSLGALLYEMLTGLPPFYSTDIQQIYESTLYQKIKFPKNVTLSNEVKNLISGLLNKNQKQRLGSILGVRQIMAHPWFGKINKSIYLSKQIEPPINFLSPDAINLDFREFQQFNETIEGLKLESKTKKQKILKDFYYDSRDLQQQRQSFRESTAFAEIQLNTTKQNNNLMNRQNSIQKIQQKKKLNPKSLRKHPIIKKQSKLTDIKRIIVRKSSKNNITIDLSKKNKDSFSQKPI